MLVGLGTVKTFDHFLYHGSSPDGLQPEIDLTNEDLQYIASINEPVSRVKPSQCGNFFASISASTVYLWLQRPTALISKVTRSLVNVENYAGANVDLVWKPDSTAVAVVTSSGFIQIYRINQSSSSSSSSPPNDGKVLEYDLRVREESEFDEPSPVRSSQGLPGSWLELQLSIRVPEGITSILGLQEDILFVPEIVSGIYALSWTGEWRPLANELYANLIEPAELGNAGITGMFYERSMELYAFLMTDGSVFMSFEKSINDDALASAESLDPQQRFAGQLLTLLEDSPLKESHENIGRRKSVHFRCFDDSTNASANESANANNYPNNNENAESNNKTNNASAMPAAENKTKVAGGIGGGVPATAISFNPRHRLVAIGTERGSVHVYYFNDQYQLLFSHKLQLPKRSPVRSISWAWDGSVLAVAAAENGCSIYSTYGHLLFSTASEEEEHNVSEYFGNAVDLFWGLGNYELYVLPAESSRFHSLSFAKYAITTCNTRTNLQNPFLITDDRLLLYTGADSELSSFNASATTTWQTHQVPSAYMAENWPIKYACASQDGKKIAVAGRRGFVICLVKRFKWRIFGNDQHEKSFCCSGGMAWYKNVLVLAAHDFTQPAAASQNQLRFYNSYLLNTNTLHTMVMERRVISMNVIMNHLLVLTADNQAHHISLHLDSEGNQLKVQRVNRISLDGLVPDPFGIQYFDWFLPLVDENASPSTIISQAAFVLLNQGQLSLVELHQLNNQSGTEASIDNDDNDNEAETKSPTTTAKNHQRWERLFLIDKIEFCWPCSIRNSWGSMHNSLWAFRGSRMFVWTNLLIGAQPGITWHHDPTPLEIGMDVYPLSVFFTNGIAVGVEQHILQRPIIGPEFRTLVKCQLVLHQIIRYLLKRKLLQDAVSFALQYEQCDYFGHAMEILVHRALEEESETLIGFHQNALLPLIVSFLRNFRQFYEVIVRCARKSEVSQWEYLFSIVGDPKELFQHCLRRNQLRTAASYLIILQTLEPYAVTSKLQVELLELALEAEEFQLCAEIVRYLTLASSKITSPGGDSTDAPVDSSAPNVSHNSDPNPNSNRRLLAVSTEEETSFYIDILVSRHARRLMQSHRIRSIGSMARAVQFPLIEWLRKERNRTAAISDLPSAFRQLHHQFGWQFPEQSRHQLEALKKSPFIASSPAVGSEIASTALISPSSMAAGGGPLVGAAAAAIKNRWRSGSGAGSFSADRNHVKQHTGPMTAGPVYRRRVFSFISPSAAATSDSGNCGASRMEIESEIRFLADACRQARCYAWCILLATMLADIETVMDALQDCSQRDSNLFNWLLEQYRKTIIETGSVEYLQFLHSIDEVLSLT